MLACGFTTAHILSGCTYGMIKTIFVADTMKHQNRPMNPP